jgi:hypothetical protein
VPIDRATKNFGILQVLQFISVVQKYLKNIEGTNPQGFKFSMFSFVLFGGIPLKHHIPQLKIFLAYALVKGLLYFLLMIMCLIKQFLPSLLHFYQLQYSPDHIVRFSLEVLEEFFHKLSKKKSFGPINQLKRRHAQ